MLARTHTAVRMSLAVFLGFISLTTMSAQAVEKPPVSAKPIGIASGIHGVKIITAEEVLTLADYDEEMVVFDARGSKQRAIGHIRWSEEFRVKTLSPAMLADSVAGPSTVIVFYGNKNSPAAIQGAKIAVKGGYTNVYWFKGGWEEWQSKGLKMDQ